MKGMFYIKLEDRALIPTITEPIYRGDNLNQKIRFLIPHDVDDIEVATAMLYLCYVRADGVADVAVLERDEADYNETYYQYAFPVDCKLTKYPGEVCAWLNIYNGDVSQPMVAKTGEVVLRVQDSKNMDDYLCDHQISALYTLQKSTNSSVETIRAAIDKKADGLVYDVDTKKLWLESGGKKIGEAVDTGAIANDDDVIRFQSVASAPEPDDPDAVIRF